MGTFILYEKCDKAEQSLRMCRDGRGLGSKLVSFAKGFSEHPYILAIFKVDSEYLRVPFKVKVDYFILYSILVSIFVIFLLLFSMNKRRRTNEAENSSFIRVCTCSSVTEIKDILSTCYQFKEIVRTSHISISIKGTF